MTYRQQIEKIYKKLESLSQRGEDAYMDFREYIDEIINDGLYSTLDDLTVTKFKISLGKYKSLEDLKKDLFKEIRFQTKSKFLKNLSNLYTTKKVFCNGFHFYDSITNKFLGDIREKEIVKDSIYAYQDERLKQKLATSELFYLEVTIGLSSSYYDAIPKYDLNYIDGTIHYGTYSQIVYGTSVYECIQSYDWKYTNPITPTYSTYWSISITPTYSVIGITGSNKSLLDKYSIAIDTLKALN